MSGTRRSVWRAMAMVGLGVLLFAAGALSLVGQGPERVASPTVPASGGVGDASGALPGQITRLQQRVRTVPKDYVSWASLGLAYVEQARVTLDPTLYPKAEGVLERSLEINKADNFVADAGMAALAAARHDFSGAREWAHRGLAVNPSNSTLYGTLGDAEVQLGHYPEAFDAIQRMVDLSPDTASLARASYAWELRGNLDEARADMQRALDDAASPGDRAFAQHYLGELAYNSGDPETALAHYEAARAADPSYAAPLEGKAKAEAALGRVDDSVTDYQHVVEQAPQPAYVMAFGELLESLGRTTEAQQQYGLFEAEVQLFESNGVALDIEPALFYANHGDPARALAAAERGIRRRDFLDLDDAYAWALHANGRDQEARQWSDKALALGTRNALYHYHAGVIAHALGDDTAARGHLGTALQINPHFNAEAAPVARRLLDQIGGPA